MSATKLEDGDYILTDGAAWIEVGKYAIRIRATKAGDGVGVEVFENGKGYNNPIDQCWVFDNELEDEDEGD